MKLSPQQRANLRCCASCKWIYEGAGDCPKCAFASYGAHYVYGNKAYRYKVTQKPWLEGKIDEFKATLMKEIGESNDKKNVRIFNS